MSVIQKPKTILQKKSKYNNLKTIIDGIVFASRKESQRYALLKVLKDKGEVISFERQVPYVLTAGIKYILDFRVLWKDQSTSYEDVKGFRTDIFKLKKKLMKHCHNIDITEL